MKKRSCWKWILPGFAVILILSMVFVGTRFLSSSPIPPSSENGVGAPGDSASSLNEGEELVTQHVSGIVAKKEIPDLVRESSLILQGRVESASPLQIEAVGGGITNYTDYTVAVANTVCGDEFESVTVRLRGGTVGNLQVFCEEAPELQIGNDYLLFLYQPDRGGGFNTEGDYYYVTGMFQGIYELALDDSGELAACSEEFGENTAALPMDQFVEQIETLSAVASTGPAYSPHEEFLENLQRNLESGFIEQEEYESLLADSQKYATIISE